MDLVLTLIFGIATFFVGVVVGLMLGKRLVNRTLLSNGIIPNEYLSKEARETFEKIQKSLERK